MGKSNIPNSTEETLALYEDEFEILNYTNINNKNYMNIKILENIMNDYEYDYNYEDDYDEEEYIMENISYNYNFDLETTKIIKNANFCVIYEDTEDEIIIGDILYNKTIKLNDSDVDIFDEIIIQVSIALKQINPNNKNFNIDQLEDERLEIFNKAIESDENLYKGKGLCYKKIIKNN